MMFHGPGFSRNRCNVVAVVCGEICDNTNNQQDEASPQLKYPFPDLSSSGRLKVLNNPTTEEFQVAVNSSAPDIVYLQGEQSGDSDEVGPLVLGYADFSTPDALVTLFGSTLPTTVYLELPNGEELAQALYSKGVQYVIYWKSVFSKYAACHFRHALFSVIQSSSSDTWDAFHVAEASFRLYCTSDNVVLPSNSNRKMNYELGPCLLGDPPKIDVVSPEADELEEENSLESLPSIKIYDEDVTVRFLLCGPPSTLDTFLLGFLVDGLNALLRIEMRGSKLHNRSSAPAPPLQAGAFTRGVVTMRCDISTCSSAHISMLVSGNAQTCFSDQLLENHIKHEVVEKIQLVHSVVNSEETKRAFSEPRRSASIACGASVCEVSMQVPTWALQVLRQLAPDVSYRSLVVLGVASIQGLSVASFEKDDAERLLFFCGQQINDTSNHDALLTKIPHWLTPPLPTRKRSEPCRESKVLFRMPQVETSSIQIVYLEVLFVNGDCVGLCSDSECFAAELKIRRRQSELPRQDLTVVKLLAEKTKEVDTVDYVYAKAGGIVTLTALLIVASEKIREATVVLRDDDDSVRKPKARTIYEAVIQEALRSYSSMESVCSEKRRMVLLREIELLQLFGAAVFADKQSSPLFSIVQAGDEAVLELLLNTNIDVNETDAEGNTVIHCSLKGSSVPHKQQTRIMQLLIAHGARVSQKNKLGLSSVHLAAANGNFSALEVLLTAYPELVHVKTVIKETPLFFAVKNNHLDCVELLLRCGASTEIHNLRKQRPIELTQSQDIRFLLNPTNISCFSKETEAAQLHSPTPTEADDEETVKFLSTSVPPLWLKKFVKWFPRYLRGASESWRGTGYPLSSLKADFRAVFGMDIDHSSLGFPKLIDFMKSFPKVCEMKVVPIGKLKAATHWVMLPAKFKCSQLKGRPPEPLIINKDVSVASPNTPKASSTPPGFEFIQQAHDSKTFKATPEPKPKPPPLAASCYNKRHQLEHPVLETLTRMRNSTSVFFLREFDFYQSYETCLKEGTCFWCKKRMLLWANFPCRHKLWCSSCKQAVVTQSTSEEKSLEMNHYHRCVVCGAKVERFIFSPPFGFNHHRLYQVISLTTPN